MICKHRSDLFNDVYREFYNNLLYIYIDGRYIETKYFKEAVQRLVLNICELNPTNKVGCMIHEFLKLSFFEKPEYRKGVYKQIRYQILPVLWKNHKAIERKKQEKLTFLANEMDNEMAGNRSPRREDHRKTARERNGEGVGRNDGHAKIHGR